MQNPKFETVHTFKTVDRLAMTDHEYLVWWSEHSSEHRCADLSTAGVDMTSERQGYLVRYQTGTDQEYYSWSPKEIMDAATVPPMKTIEIELNPDDPDVTNTIQRISEMAYEQFGSKFRMERCEVRGGEPIKDKVGFYRNMVAEQIEALVRSIVSDRELHWSPEDIQTLLGTSWDKLTNPEHMRPYPTVELLDSCPKVATAEPHTHTTSRLEPKYSPLFEKVHAAFLEQLKVTSLPQALEAALVVYTDGLTYSEE